MARPLSHSSGKGFSRPHRGNGKETPEKEGARWLLPYIRLSKGEGSRRPDEDYETK